MIRAVLFDFDGVLVNSMPFHVQAWQDAFSRYDISVAPDKILLGEGARSIELAREIFAVHDVQMSPDELEAFVNDKQALYRQLTAASFDPAAEPLLQDLRQRGIRTGLVTGTPRDNVEQIVSEEAIGLFDVLVTADDVSAGKPNPECYLLAAQMLRVLPDSSRVIENAPLGIEAARLAGMSVWALTTTLTRFHLSGADRLFTDLSEVAKQLDLLAPGLDGLDTENFEVGYEPTS